MVADRSVARGATSRGASRPSPDAKPSCEAFRGDARWPTFHYHPVHRGLRATRRRVPEVGRLHRHTGLIVRGREGLDRANAQKPSGHGEYGRSRSPFGCSSERAEALEAAGLREYREILRGDVGGTSHGHGLDLDGLTATLTAAFAPIPCGAGRSPDPDDLSVWWRYCIASALRYPWVWISGDYAAVSVWIPPDGTELTEEEEEGVEPLIRDLIGHRCDDVLELLDRFEASHPQGGAPLLPEPVGNAPRSSRRGARHGAPVGQPGDGRTPRAYRRSLSRPIPQITPAMNASGSGRSASSRPRTELAGWRRCGARWAGGAAGVADVAGERRHRRGRLQRVSPTTGLDRFLEHWSDDLDHRSIEGAPDDRGPIHGKDAMRAYVQDWIDTFDEFKIDPVERSKPRAGCGRGGALRRPRPAERHRNR